MHKMSKCTEKGLLRLLNRNSWLYGSWNLDLQPFLISNVRGGLLIFDLHKNCVQVVVIFGSNMTTHSFQMSVNFTQFLTPLLSVSIFWQRAIFQTFWKDEGCAKFLFFELETSNFGYLLIFWFPFTVQSFRKIGQHWY